MKYKLVLIIGLISSTLLSLSLVTRVKQIDCYLETESQLTTCPTAVTTKLENDLKSQSLVFHDLRRLAAVSPSLFGQYVITSWYKVWPNKIKLTIKPDELNYQLKLNDQVYVLSQSGVAHTETKPIEHLIMVDAKDLNSTNIDQYVVQFHPIITKIINYLRHNNFTPTKLELTTNQQVTINLPPNLKILINLKKPNPTAGLKEIIDQKEQLLPIQKNKTLVIDLRFKLPVLHWE